MNLKVLIADDEPIAREVIVSYLKDFDAVESIIEASNGLEVIKQINKHSPDLLFLDIEMPKMDGISALSSDKLTHQPAVVFTTAYNQFALKAFELNAIDYLLKPFDRARFHDTMNRVLDKLKLTELKDFHEQWTKINLDYQNAKMENDSVAFPAKIVVRDSKRIRHIPTHEIVLIQAAGDYIEIIDDQGKFLLYKTISDLEEKLNPLVFRRVHKSFIINCDKIVEVRPHTNSEYFFQLTNGQVIKSGRTYKDKITDLIKGTF